MERTLLKYARGLASSPTSRSNAAALPSQPEENTDTLAQHTVAVSLDTMLHRMYPPSRVMEQGFGAASGPARDFDTVDPLPGLLVRATRIALGLEHGEM